jgi:hypothetical protein
LVTGHEHVGQLLRLAGLQGQVQGHAGGGWMRLRLGLGLGQLDHGTDQRGCHGLHGRLRGQALGIPLGKLRLVHDFGFCLGGHVKHGLLVVAPGFGGQLEAAGAVLQQLQGAVKYGLAELLHVHHAVAPCAKALRALLRV